jgi:hypothetical protein
MKLVREHINEKFEEHSDPIEDMGMIEIPIHPYIRELYDQDKSYDRAREFLSSLIGKKLSGKFKIGIGDWDSTEETYREFIVTRYTFNERREDLWFEDKKAYRYSPMWGETYRIG